MNQLHSAFRILGAFLLVSFATAASAAEETLHIENDLYSVRVFLEHGTFHLHSKVTGKTFFSMARFNDGFSQAQVVTASDPSLGQGKALEITCKNSNTINIALYPGSPFVAFRPTYRNPDTKPLVLNRASLFWGKVTLGKPITDLRALSSRGGMALLQPHGSYAFYAIADPATHNGLVTGWLTHDRASGTIHTHSTNDTLLLQARADYGTLRLKPKESALGETFLVGYFDDARLGLEHYADAMAKYYNVKLRPKEAGYCTWYMEKYKGACDEVHLAELANYAAKNLGPYGFGFIQIDDQWQLGMKTNGPRKNFTSHDPKGPYPHGMKATAEMISKLGLTPGLWFMPFAGTYQDPFFKNHQDWFVKTKDGDPYDTRWGGTCLDMTHPGAREYVSNIVSRIAHDWGYTLFKMDGFWTGSATPQMYVNDGYKEDDMGDAVFANPDKTNIEAMRDGVKLIRESAGTNTFLLGCCLAQNMRSLSGSLGLLDAMRVGPDTGSGAIGYSPATRFWFLNGRVWWNDPDCVSVRAKVNLNPARLHGTFAAIADTLFYNSDWMPDFPPDRLDILRRCIPGHGLPARPVDVFKSRDAHIWQVTDTRAAVRRDVVALYNFSNDALEITDDTHDLSLPPAQRYVAFDFWDNKFLPPFSAPLTSKLFPHSCRVLAIRPVSEFPQLLSTSRHVTQGMVDVTDEKWDATARTLSAASRVVGDDPYELRLIVPEGQNSWKLTAFNLSPEDLAAGVKSSFTQDGSQIRATLLCATNRTIRWTASFQPAAAAELILAKPLTLPPAPRQPDLNLSSLKLKFVQNGWKHPQLDRNVGGRPLGVLDKIFPTGVGVHAPSHINCPIPVGAKRFVATVGIDHSRRKSKNTLFIAEIYGSTTEKGDKPQLLGRSPKLSLATIQDWNFNIELDPRFQELQLIIDACGDKTEDWADWVQAGFLLK